MNKFDFTLKLLKSGFVANVKCRVVSGFDMLHHKLFTDACSFNPFTFL